MIKKITKWTVSLAILSVGTIVSAASHPIITNYADLFAALKAGDQVRAVITFDQCVGDSNTVEHQGVIGGMDFAEFIHKQHLLGDGKQKHAVSTSLTKLVQNGTLGSVFNYVRLRVFEDNSVEIFSEFLSPVHYTPMRSASYKCQLSNGNDQQGVVLYDLSQNAGN